MTTHSSTADFPARRLAFRALHERGCFVIPNPWDPGSARYLRQLGFQALATTSAGFAFSRGLSDSSRAMPVDAVLAHIADVVNAVDLPVNADFESGYADDPEGVAASVRRCVATGVAGLSIEDATGDRARPLHDLPQAVERLAAARTAIDESGTGVLLTARAECFLVGDEDPLRESIRRLTAYARGGRRRPVRAGHLPARRHQDAHGRTRAEAGQSSGRPEHRADRGRFGRARRPPYQRRLGARPGRVDAVHGGSAGHRRGRTVHHPRRRRVAPRARRVVQELVTAGGLNGAPVPLSQNILRLLLITPQRA